MAYYNRYSALQLKNDVDFFPDIALENKQTDKFEIYESGKTRFDKLSQKYYGEPFWGWLINLANPEQVGLEFLIPHGTALRIPFPLDVTLKELKQKVDLKLKYYGY